METNRTIRLYDEDACCRRFDAVVTSCLKERDQFIICLDRTAFYPEGGGQPGDSGSLILPDGSSVTISDTHEKDGLVRHFADKEIPPHTKITGCIDWEPRFDRMQNHTGEHIVSGLIHEKYGANNVGFHMGSDFITIDLDREFSMEELAGIEEKANEIVWSNVSVKTDVCTEEEAAQREFRSKKELHGIVRIVVIPGADSCACCGTHVKQTGEIGLIRILTSVKFRNGCRIEMLCGRRAYQYDSLVSAQNRQISVLLSAPVLETAGAVQKMKDNLADITFRSIGLEQRYFGQIALSSAGEGNILLITQPMSPDSVRRLAVAVMETCGGICVVAAGEDGSGYKYAVGKTDGDLRGLVKEMNAALGGRGGGKPFFAQGSIQSDREAILRFFPKDQYKRYIIE